MSHKKELVKLLESAIIKLDKQDGLSRHAEFLVDFKGTLIKIMDDTKNDNLPKTGTPRGLTRWLGDYIDQMEDKSVWSIVVQIDELLKNHY